MNDRTRAKAATARDYIRRNAPGMFAALTTLSAYRTADTLNWKEAEELREMANVLRNRAISAGDTLCVIEKARAAQSNSGRTAGLRKAVRNHDLEELVVGDHQTRE